MRRLSLFITVLAAASLLAAGAPSAVAEPAKLVIAVTGLKDVKGQMMIALFDQAGYETDRAVASVNVPVTTAEVRHSFANLAPGAYGVKLFHDVDGDGKMGTNPFGLPTEPYGFSNNARGQFGPAKWPAAAFEVGAGETVHAIRLD